MDDGVKGDGGVVDGALEEKVNKGTKDVVENGAKDSVQDALEVDNTAKEKVKEDDKPSGEDVNQKEAGDD